MQRWAALRRIEARLAWQSLLVAGVLALAASPAWTQPFFQPTSGPNGGRVEDLAFASNGSLFALAGPLYRSSDGGSSWTELTSAPPGFRGIATSPSGALYGFGYSTLWRSTDDGINWVQLTNAPDGFIDLAFVPGLIFAGTYEGLYRSNDDGATWSQASTPAVYTGEVVQTSDGALHVGASAELYRSDDGGLTWALEATLPRPITTLAVRPAGGLYLGVEQRYDWDPGPFPGGLYAYDGVSPPYSSGLPDAHLTSILVRDDGSIFVGSTGTCGSFVCWGPGIHRSTNGGASWTHVASPLSPILCLIRGAGDALFAATGNLGTDIGSYPAAGILTASGTGTTWVGTNRGLPHACTYDLAAGLGGMMFAAADQTVFWTADQGVNWTAVSVAPPIVWGESTISYDLAVHPSGDIFALSGAGLSRSRDLGASWTLLRDDLIGGHGFQLGGEMEITALGTLLVPYWSGVLRSTDRGDTWTQIEAGLPSFTDITAIAVGPQGRAVVCAGNQTFLSEDDGLTWSPIATRRGKLAVSPDEQSIYVSRYDGVDRLYPVGSSWQIQALSTGPIEPTDLIVDSNGFVYTSARQGVMRTQVGNPSWETLSGYYDEYAFFLGYHKPLGLGTDAHLYVGSSELGVFRSSVPLTGATDTRETHEQFVIWGSSPNPFRSNTTIQFALAEPAPVGLAVFDVRGRMVSRLLAGERLPAGPHALEWRAPQGLSSGVYFYRLTVGDRQRTGRMLRIE